MCNLTTEWAGVGLAAEIFLFCEGKKRIKKIIYTGNHTSSFHSLLHLKSSSLVLCWCILGFFPPYHLDSGFSTVQGDSLEMKRRRIALF